VLGHNSCGAVKSAVDGVKLGNITALLKHFEPALETLTKADGPRDSHNDALVQRVAEANARLTAAGLTQRSAILKELVAARQLTIAAAMHDITSGRVSWLT
jgi:carbonic anhydrase